MSRNYRKFDEDCGASGGRDWEAMARVARELGINKGTLGNWCAKASRAAGEGEVELTETERAELARLRKEIVELRMQRDVLKRSVALWVDEAMGR